MHHTKDKGDLAVSKAVCRLMEMGYYILFPMSEHLPFDIVAYKDNKFLRVQVKYKKVRKGCIDICFRSMWADKNGCHINQIDKNAVDIWCVYCPDTDKCYFVNPKIFGRSVTLRLDPPKKGNDKQFNFLKDFEEVPTAGIEPAT